MPPCSPKSPADCRHGACTTRSVELGWTVPASKFEYTTIVTYTTIVFKCGPNVFHSMFGDGRCCPSDSRHQELFVVPRVCGCISYSRHMALRKNSIIYLFCFRKRPWEGVGPAMALQGACREASYSSLDSQLSGLRLVHRVDWAASNSL